MNLLLTFDRNFLQHGVVMLRSLFYNNPSADFNIYVYTEDKEEVSEKLSTEFEQESVVFTYLDFDQSRFPKLKTKFHYGEGYYKIIYLRLNIGEVLPDLNRILLIDVDLIVNGDIREFYEQDLKESELMAAVAEVRPSNFKKFGIEPEKRNAKTNFNCGVTLVDLKKWRDWGVSKKAVDHIIKYEDILAAPTQDTLNPLFYNNWKICLPKYNLHHFYLQYPFKVEDLPYTKDEIKDSIENPIIVHYSGAMRPWEYLDINPYSYLYWKYLNMTSYKGYKYKDKNLKNILIRYRRLLSVSLSRLKLIAQLK